MRPWTPVHSADWMFATIFELRSKKGCHTIRASATFEVLSEDSMGKYIWKAQLI